MAGAPKKSWKFLQKYWHKGAFFQDAGDAGRDAVGGDAIFRRDFSAPTGDDKMDKTVLPKVRLFWLSPPVHTPVAWSGCRGFHMRGHGFTAAFPAVSEVAQ